MKKGTCFENLFAGSVGLERAFALAIVFFALIFSPLIANDTSGNRAFELLQSDLGSSPYKDKFSCREDTKNSAICVLSAPTDVDEDVRMETTTVKLSIVDKALVASLSMSLKIADSHEAKAVFPNDVSCTFEASLIASTMPHELSCNVKSTPYALKFKYSGSIALESFASKSDVAEALGSLTLLDLLGQGEESFFIKPKKIDIEIKGSPKLGEAIYKSSKGSDPELTKEEYENKLAEFVYSIPLKLGEVEDLDYDMALSIFKAGMAIRDLALSKSSYVSIRIKNGLDQFIDLADLTSDESDELMASLINESEITVKSK